MSTGRQTRQIKVVNLLSTSQYRTKFNTETMHTEQTRRNECAITR